MVSTVHESSLKTTQNRTWTKGTQTQLHLFNTYRKTILHYRINPGKSRASNPEPPDQKAAILPLSQAAGKKYSIGN